MNRIKLPINEITVEDRQRQDLGDITDLARSLDRYGLIQPIVITQHKRLLAGGRRLAAATKLGWQSIDVVFRETLTSDEMFEIELEENVRRKDMSWQERCLTIDKIYQLKRTRGIIEGFKWGMEETGEMFGLKKVHVSYCVKIAAALRADEKSGIWQCVNMADAWRFLLREEEQAALAELAQRQQEATLKTYLETASLDDPLDTDEPKDLKAYSLDELSVEEAKKRYYDNPLNPPGTFEEYWAERLEYNAKRKNLVYLSGNVIRANCLDFMSNDDNRGRFDDIITDPPYAIDTDYMDLLDLDTVSATHQVEENKKLLTDFFPLAYRVLKPQGWLVLWCDQMLWQFLYDQATAAGFRVTRWPLTWVKTNTCGNQAAQYNITKSTEIAMWCAKGGATLVKPRPTSVVIASNEAAKLRFGGHPFVKPYECWDAITDYITLKGQTVYEPFGGRGSGVEAMLRRELHVVTTEMVDVHYNALLENVKRYYLELNPNFIFA